MLFQAAYGVENSQKYVNQLRLRRFCQIFEIFVILVKKDSKLAKNANIDPKMAKKGAKNQNFENCQKLSKIIYLDDLGSSCYVFRDFSETAFLSPETDFRTILVRNVKYYGQVSLCLNFFWLIYAKFTGTHIKTPFNISKPLFSWKKVKNDSKKVEKTLKLQ